MTLAPSHSHPHTLVAAEFDSVDAITAASVKDFRQLGED